MRSQQSVVLPLPGLFLVLGATQRLSLILNTWAPLLVTEYNLYGFLFGSFLDWRGQTGQYL